MLSITFSNHHYLSFQICVLQEKGLHFMTRWNAVCLSSRKTHVFFSKTPTSTWDHTMIKADNYHVLHNKMGKLFCLALLKIVLLELRLKYLGLLVSFKLCQAIYLISLFSKFFIAANIREVDNKSHL